MTLNESADGMLLLSMNVQQQVDIVMSDADEQSWFFDESKFDKDGHMHLVAIRPVGMTPDTFFSHVNEVKQQITTIIGVLPFEIQDDYLAANCWIADIIRLDSE